MGLQSMEAGELLSRWRVYPAAEVNDLLARIRAAVAAERGAVAGLCVLRDYPYGQADYLRRKWMDDFRRRTDKFMDESAALDALLADGGG